MQITRADIEASRSRWYDTSILRPDGNVEYREKKEFGSRHAVFESRSFVGDVHTDRFNATDAPLGTIRHVSNYVEEKTGIPEPLTTLAIILGGAYLGYKSANWIRDNL